MSILWHPFEIIYMCIQEAYGYYLYAVQQIVAQLQHVSPQGSLVRQ